MASGGIAAVRVCEPPPQLRLQRRQQQPHQRQQQQQQILDMTALEAQKQTNPSNLTTKDRGLKTSTSLYKSSGVGSKLNSSFCSSAAADSACSATRQESFHSNTLAAEEKGNPSPVEEWIYYDEALISRKDMGMFLGGGGRSHANSLFQEYVNYNRCYDSLAEASTSKHKNSEADGDDDDSAVNNGGIVYKNHASYNNNNNNKTMGSIREDLSGGRSGMSAAASKAGRSYPIKLERVPPVLGGPRPDLEEPLIPPKVATCCACGVLAAIVFMWILYEYVRQQTEWTSPHVDVGNVEFFNEVFARRVADIIKRATTESLSAPSPGPDGRGVDAGRMLETLGQGGILAAWGGLVGGGLGTGRTVKVAASAGERSEDGDVVLRSAAEQDEQEDVPGEEGLVGWGANVVARAAARLSSGPAPGEVEEWSRGVLAGHARRVDGAAGAALGSASWAMVHARRYPMDGGLSPWGLMPGAQDVVLDGGMRGVKAAEDYKTPAEDEDVAVDRAASPADLSRLVRGSPLSALSAGPPAGSPLSKTVVSASASSTLSVSGLKPLTTPRKPLCDLFPAVLFGNVSGDVNREHKTLTLAQVQAWHKDLAPGGEWRPPGCVARYRLAVVIPYRDRLAHLTVLLAHLLPILKRQQLHFRIFVVEQSGNLTFNKGRIMNAAFKEALKMYDFQCVVFHDVDLIPEDDRNMYSCPVMPRHMSVAVDEMNYTLSYGMLVGGVLNMRVEHFQHVNGYSNMYWGWGAEDDDMAYRILHVGLKIFRPPSKIARYQMIKHVKRKATSWSIRGRLLRTAVKRYHLDGLNSVQYSIKFIHTDPLYTHLMVDIGKPDMPIDQR